jgi:hypothetical protein
MTAFEYSSARQDWEFEGFEEAFFKDFVGILGVGEEDTAFENRVSKLLLQEPPVVSYTLQSRWEFG